MSTIVLENTPTVIDLANETKTTGWILDGGIAKHESCNAGEIEVLPSVIVPVTGMPYTVSYQVSNYTSGTIRLRIGTTQGIVRTANGNYTETVIAGGVNPTIRLYSDGNLWVQLIDVRISFESTETKQRNTMGFYEGSNKWDTFYSFTSDFGFSLSKDLFTFKNGRLYKHDQTINNRNNIYGVQYKTVVKFVDTSSAGVPKSYLSISYEANQLMVTTDNGITTSIGQISELIASDFLKDTLIDGITQIDIYDVEGIYSASFLRDTRNGGDIINGDPLKGTYIIVELIQANDQLLIFKNVRFHSEQSKIGVR